MRRIVRLVVVGALFGLATVPVGPVDTASALAACPVTATLAPAQRMECGISCSGSRPIQVTTWDNSGAGSSLWATAACGVAAATCASGQHNGCSATSSTDAITSGSGTCHVTNDNPSTRTVSMDCGEVPPPPMDMSSFHGIGTMTTSPPLYYPVLDPSPGTPKSFTLTATTCTGTHASSSPGVLFGSCTVNLTGTLVPKAGIGTWCGWAGGAFTGTIAITSGLTSVTYAISSGIFDTTGGVGVATAFATRSYRHGILAASFSAIPAVGQNCISGVSQFAVTFSGAMLLAT